MELPISKFFNCLGFSFVLLETELDFLLYFDMPRSGTSH